MAHDGRTYKPKKKLTIRDFYRSKIVYKTELAWYWGEDLKKLVLYTDIISNRVWFTVYNGDKTIGTFADIQTALDVYNEF